MKRSRKIRFIAVLMAFITLFTSSNFAVAIENETSVSNEISEFAESDQGALDKDEVSYAMDGDAFLNMLLNAQMQSPIQNLFEVFGYESEELNTELLEENTELFLVGEPLVQDEYRVFTFLQKDGSGSLKVFFFTENTSQNVINAELNVNVECLEAISINEVLEYNTVEDTLEEPVIEEPTTATESAIHMLSIDGTVETLKESTQEEATQPKTVENGIELRQEERVDEIDEKEIVEQEVIVDEEKEEVEEAREAEKTEEVGEVEEAEVEEKTEADLKNSVVRTALVSVFCVSNTEIAPTINKAANLVSNCNESADYDITLTVNGASKLSTTVTTQLADVIFVLDISNSMNDTMGNDSRWGKLKTAMDGMVTALLPQDSQNRISIVAYGGSKDTNNSDYKLLLSKSSDVTTVKSAYNKSLSNMRQSVFGTDNTSNGGTNSKAGFIGALKELQQLKSTSQDRNQYVIYMSDGVPTFYKKYKNEYQNDVFLDSCSYDSIVDYGGDGSNYSVDAAKQAINVARRINREFPNTVIYTVGISSTATYSSYLLNTSNYANGGFNKIYKSADNAADLETVFKDLTQTVNNSIPLTNIKAQDKLSKYVALYEESDIMLNGVSIQPTINPENENKIDYIQNETVVATYNKETKTMDWRVADSLGEGQTNTLTYSVHTTKAAIAYEDTYKGKEDCYQGTADSGTHACNAGTSEEEQYGYRSNEYAKVTYMDEDQIGTLTFNHPVVQSAVRGTLAFTKQLDKDYAGLLSDTWYYFDVTLESSKLSQESMSHLKFTTSGQYTTPEYNNGKVTLTVQLKAAETMLISNLPMDTHYIITEDTDKFDNPYYEIGGVNIIGTEGSEYQVNQTTVIGMLEKTGISGKEKYNLISYEKKDGSKRWYNADTMEEIVDTTLLSKLIENKTLKKESDFVLGKEISGTWSAGIQESDLAKTASNGYYNSDGIWVWARNAVRNEYTLNTGNTSTIYTDEKGKQVSPDRFGNLGYIYYEYRNAYGEWRPCYRDYSYWDDCWYYYDLKYNTKIPSNKVRDREYDYWWGLVDYNWIIVRRSQITTASHYSFNNHQYETKEALRSALIASTSKDYITYDSGTTVIFITYACNYASNAEYLKAEKGYYEAKVATYESFVENFSFTGAKTELTFVNHMEQIIGDITVSKKIDRADKVDTNTFIFRLENTDANSPAYGMVAFQSVSLESGVLTGEITFKNIPMGIYKITEEENMNYNLESITNEGIVSLEKSNKNQKIHVKNKMVSIGGFSDSSVAENEGTKFDNLISYIKKFIN